VQKEAALSAKRVLVTVEERVDSLRRTSPNACVLPSWTINAIAVVPGGAFPSYARGHYPRSNAFYLAWDRIARDREAFNAWIAMNVMRKGPEFFASYARRTA
jgi:glutaconate CoA-transferase subunit A